MAYAFIPSVFLIEIASNGASGIHDTQPNLQRYLDVYLNGGTNPGGFQYPGFYNQMNQTLHGGDWSVVWGPCVYCERNADTATNAMYVAYSPSLNTYVVCIAATNPISFFDWIFEDGNVDPHLAAPWPPKLPYKPIFRPIPPPTTTPAISAATATGISDLLTQPEMVDPKNGNLQAFLAAKKNANATLIFAGHSLAGALSPTLAFYLYGQPASSGWKQVLVLPSAGATPGNQGFAAAFVDAYPPALDPTSGLYWNTDHTNNHDVVPHAWDKLGEVVQPIDADKNYPSIWGVLEGPGPATVGGFINFAVKAATRLANGYYTAISQQWFTPSFGFWNWTDEQYPPVWKPMPVYTDAQPLSTLDELGDMIEGTHVDEYYNFFGVVPAPKMQKPAPKKKTKPDYLA